MMTPPDVEQNEGVRIVETTPSRIAIIEAWKAGQYDPPMQDWLQLPVGDSCPVDEDHRRWGTVNPGGYFYVRKCKECQTRFRGEVTPHMISEIVNALSGVPRRFVRG